MVEVGKFFDAHIISLKKDRFWRYGEKDDSVLVTFFEDRTNKHIDLHFSKNEFHRLRTSMRIKELEDMKWNHTAKNKLRNTQRRNPIKIRWQQLHGPIRHTTKSNQRTPFKRRNKHISTNNKRRNINQFQ